MPRGRRSVPPSGTYTPPAGLSPSASLATSMYSAAWKRFSFSQSATLYFSVLPLL